MPKRLTMQLNKPSISLHQTALALLTLIQITLFLFLTKRHILSSLHACDLDGLFALSMPPTKSLNHASVFIISVDCPLSPRYFHIADIFGEVKFGQENLSWRVLWSHLICF